MAESFTLFGGSKPFAPPPWKTTDDRVRGGSSQSCLSPLEGNCASFHGNLDIKTLGGAGFASQYSPENDDKKTTQAASAGNDEDSNGTQVWDLSAYDGIEISTFQGDEKVYTLILRDDETAEKREDGREQAGINWEADFQAAADGGTVFRSWNDFKATYRGKERKDVGSLRTEHVRRIAIMMRSYFGTQEGEFRLMLKSILARKELKEAFAQQHGSEMDSQRTNGSMM